ncbi:hypothetical protein GF339_13990 [candidate division KSB3 bacterium]|uniref:Uncharacterized protein n=1 Tax=candidate division KSB3 bacterium TaxID=2044937 RepID=A0A9D5Q6X5_9BACT|nr:hypothetical protein [candidate division KSB3 bacterium]MBD3325692.1 hypothetical protein [candidate division KSB3 bacterium]
MRGMNVTLLKTELKDFLIRKYGASGDGVAIPEDPFLAYSLLYDVYYGSRVIVSMMLLKEEQGEHHA